MTKNEIQMVEVVQEVRVRKYEVDTIALCDMLRVAKKQIKISNKQLAEKLNVPLTMVEHWFRKDKYFAIPDEDIWFKLKNILNITNTDFDKQIMTFETKPGVYDMGNRLYLSLGIAPTLLAGSGDEKYVIKR